MKNWFKARWHEFWYKCYHLPKSVQGVSFNEGKVSYVDKIYTHYHFERAWHHGVEYHKLDPKGMHSYAIKCVMKGFKMSREEAENILNKP